MTRCLRIESFENNAQREERRGRARAQSSRLPKKPLSLSQDKETLSPLYALEASERVLGGAVGDVEADAGAAERDHAPAHL